MAAACSCGLFVRISQKKGLCISIFGNTINWVSFGGIVLAFILKLLDNSLGTAKTIFLAKGKYLLGSLFNALSTFFYLAAIVSVAKTSSMAGVIAMCVATFLGTLIPSLIIKKAEPERLFIFDITADTLESGKAFADELRERNIPVRTYFTYDKKLNKTLACNIYCSTKEESKLVESLIRPNFKWHLIVSFDNQD